MIQFIRALIRGWDQFFFAPVSMFPAAVFRVVFSAVLLAMYSLRFADWRFYFTDEGYLKSSEALEVLPEALRPAFAWYPTSEFSVWFLHLVFLVALLCLLLGVFGRLAALLSFILHLAFMQRNYAIVYGADIVTTFFFFALIFMDNSRHLSVLNLVWKRKERAPSAVNEIFSIVGVRLAQIQLCIIYGYTGLEKLKGPSWWDGTAVWAVLGNQQIMMFDATWMKYFPLVIAFMTHATVLWEVYFPALVWFKPLRRWVLLFGIFLHGMIALSVGLIFFSTIMVSVYFLFVDPRWLEEKFVSLKRRLAV